MEKTVNLFKSTPAKQTINRSLNNLIVFCQKGKIYKMPYSDLLKADLEKATMLGLAWYKVQKDIIVFGFYDYAGNLFEKYSTDEVKK